MADKIGIKKTIGFGAILAFAGSALRGASTDYSSLFLFSLIFGLGLGGCFANLPKLASSWFPGQPTILTMGILTGGVMAGVGAAMAFTVPLIYPLTNGYSGVFYLWSVPLLIGTVLWWCLVPRTPGNGVKSEAEKAPSGEQIFRNKTVWLLASLLFLHNFFFYSWTGWVPTYLLEKGASPSAAGPTTSIMLWVSVPTVIVVPLLTSRANLPRKLFVWIPSLVFAVLAVGILSASEFFLWIIMAIAGLVNVLRFNTLMTLPVEFVSRERAGVAGGIVVALGYGGAAVGPTISGRILDATGSFGLIFTILAIVSLISTGFAFLIPKTSH